VLIVYPIGISSSQGATRTSVGRHFLLNSRQI
jgi:hypothetical protein